MSKGCRYAAVSLSPVSVKFKQRKWRKSRFSVYQAIETDIPHRSHFKGEEFGIARLVGLYYDYDDVSPRDAQTIAEMDAAIVKECARIASGGDA